MRPLRWELIPSDSCPYQETRLGHRETSGAHIHKGLPFVKAASKGQRSQKNPIFLAPWSGTSSLQNLGKNKFLLFNLLVQSAVFYYSSLSNLKYHMCWKHRSFGRYKIHLRTFLWDSRRFEKNKELYKDLILKWFKYFLHFSSSKLFLWTWHGHSYLGVYVLYFFCYISFLFLLWQISTLLVTWNNTNVFINLKFWRSEVQIGSYWAKIKILKGLSSFWRF